MADRYRKQTLFHGIGVAGQERLRNSRVTLIGCGALGSVIAEGLTRAGVGFLRIADRDFVELSNLQRQVLYDEEDVANRLPKVIAAANHLGRINSEVTIEPQICDVTPGNILELIQDADVIMDGTDNFETRFLINDAAVDTNIPWVHGGCVGSHGQVMSIIPGQTPCFCCLMPEMPGPGTTETCDSAGVIGAAVQIVASLQIVEALKILTGQRDQIRSSLTVVDVWDLSLRQIQLDHLLIDKQCACCTHGERRWLTGSQGTRTTVLCGRNSVQLTPTSPAKLSLPRLSEQLQNSGTCRLNPFLLVFRPSDSECEFTLFSDGRAIITGTEDPSEARTLYARYIGQ